MVTLSMKSIGHIRLGPVLAAFRKMPSIGLVPKLLPLSDVRVIVDMTDKFYHSLAYPAMIRFLRG